MSPWVPWEISSLPGGTRLKAKKTWRGKQTTALFFQGPTRAPQDLPCLPDTSSAFLHTKNKPSAACGQQPAADVGQSPVSLDSSNARAAWIHWKRDWDTAGSQWEGAGSSSHSWQKSWHRRGSALGPPPGQLGANIHDCVCTPPPAVGDFWDALLLLRRF